MKKKSKPEQNPFVAIGASLGGLFLGAIALFLIFAPLQAAMIVPIAWAFAVLGIGLAFFAAKKK